MATRTITLTVPTHRCTNEWWVMQTPETVASLLELVGTVVEALPNTHEEQVLKLKQKLEDAHETTTIAARLSAERVEDVCNRRIEERDQMVQMLTEQVNNYKAMLNQAQTASDAHQKATEQLLQAVESRTGLERTTAQEMGGVAEAEVEQLVMETLACDIVDTSRITAQGDRLVTTPNGLKLLLEVKNVERLHSKNDMEKFRRDVFQGAQNQRINAALMVSLKSASIPNISGACDVSFLNVESGRVPIVVLSSNSRTAIQLSLHAVAQLQSIAEREVKARGGCVSGEVEVLEKERCDLQRFLPGFCKFVQENDAHIESRIEMLQRLLDEAGAERAKQKDLMFQILKLRQCIPWLGQDEGHDLEFAISIVNQWHERKGEYPKTSEMTQPQRNAIKNAGGLKIVVDAAKKRPRADDNP